MSQFSQTLLAKASCTLYRAGEKQLLRHSTSLLSDPMKNKAVMNAIMTTIKNFTLGFRVDELNFDFFVKLYSERTVTSSIKGQIIELKC